MWTWYQLCNTIYSKNTWTRLKLIKLCIIVSIELASCNLNIIGAWVQYSTDGLQKSYQTWNVLLISTQYIHLINDKNNIYVYKYIKICQIESSSKSQTLIEFDPISPLESFCLKSEATSVPLKLWITSITHAWLAQKSG